MPQMSPMMWMILYIYFFFIYYFINMMIYFFKFYNLKFKKMNLNISLNKFICKW
uniref:ATP synthase F0 subunit 8 n=1 Tax=Anagyrus galinae TaxID=3085291 RepID=UPI002A8280E5|nr:ATP synthase F0 subunit 8 [Anagyrus galinae]WON65599.1 ATP synthase F0 subunit 8 [Anagyrus galinae]